MKRYLSNIARYGAAIIILAAGVTAVIAQQTPRDEKLLNGLKLLMWSDPSAQNVRVSVRIHSGAAFDPQGKEGLMRLLSDNIFPSEVTREYFKDDLGGSFDIRTTYDYIQIDVSSTPENSLQMLETLGAAITNIQIDKETTAKLKETLLAEIEKNGTDAADTAVRHALFQKFPYARPIDGTVSSVKSIDFSDLISAKQRFMTADNATITVSGKIDKDNIFRAIRRYFGSWLKADKLVPSTFRQPDDPSSAWIVETASTPAVRVAFRGTARSDKDLCASLVFASLLESRLRGRVPAAYKDSVSVVSEPHVLPGIFVVRIGAGSRDLGIDTSKPNSFALLNKAIADPITDAEFQAAKNAVAAELQKRRAEDLWLDADTFKTAGAAADSSAAASVTIADVRAYANKLASAPRASAAFDIKAN